MKKKSVNGFWNGKGRIQALGAMLGVFICFCISACGEKYSLPAQPVSHDSQQLYVLAYTYSVLVPQFNLVAVAGPIRNQGGSFSFNLPTPAPDSFYVLFGVFDPSNLAQVPSSGVSFCVPMGVYGLSPAGKGCPWGSGNIFASYFSSQSGIDISMTPDNGACLLEPSNGYNYDCAVYAPETGASVTLSGTISESGLAP